MRAYLPDNVIWRQLGIHNTFKTLVLTPETTVTQMKESMFQKICKGMTYTQRALVAEECHDYTLYDFLPSGALAKLKDNDKPFQSVRKLAYRSTNVPLPTPPTQEEVNKKSIPNLLNHPPPKPKSVELPEGTRMIRAFTDDNPVFRELGIHNTFKTLILTEDTTVSELIPIFIAKLSKAMTSQQIDRLKRQCESYRLYLPSQTGPDMLLEPSSKPYKMGEFLLFKNAASHHDAEHSNTAHSPDAHDNDFIVRAYLNENMVFKQLGLNNTFKALVITPNTTVAMIEEMMVKKMCKAMTPIQTQVVHKECRHYCMYEVLPNAGARLMEKFEKPFGVVKEVIFKPSPFAAEAAGTIRGRSMSGDGRAGNLPPPPGVNLLNQSLPASSILAAVEAAFHLQHPLVGSHSYELLASPQAPDAPVSASSSPVSASSSPDFKSPLSLSCPNQTSTPGGSSSSPTASPRTLSPSSSFESQSSPRTPQPPTPSSSSSFRPSAVDEDFSTGSPTSSQAEPSEPESASQPQDASRQPSVETTIVFISNEDDAPTPASILLASGMLEDATVRINVEVTPGWKIKIPTSVNQTIGGLISEVKARLRSKIDRLLSMSLDPETIDQISLEDADQVELFPEDSVSDAWKEGETLHVLWA
ncbi:MAG: hypothetical protein Q8P67_04050 [archaeon]|nr:hypothetical protein [archaeon]